jgi:hypothetical protein
MRRTSDTCRACVHFRNDPAYLESVFQGMNVMSSAWASVVAEDGICLRHDRYLSAEACCPDFTPALVTARRD